VLYSLLDAIVLTVHRGGESALLAHSRMRLSLVIAFGLVAVRVFNGAFLSFNAWPSFCILERIVGHPFELLAYSLGLVSFR